MQILKLSKYLFILLIASSCAVKSGYYAKKNGKWVFVSQKTGILSNPVGGSNIDDSDFDYSYSDEFIWPVPSSKRISSFFGRRKGKHHDGIDIPARSGNSVVASAEGKVVFSGWMRGYGRVVVLKHADEYNTVYAHNSSNLVKKGQKVSRGEVIAKIGSSGRSSGAHLHFEIRKNNKVSDPEKYLSWARRQRLASQK